MTLEHTIVVENVSNGSPNQKGVQRKDTLGEVVET